jgi:hypothetical protein
MQNLHNLKGESALIKHDEDDSSHCCSRQSANLGIQ